MIGVLISFLSGVAAFVKKKADLKFKLFGLNNEAEEAREEFRNILLKMLIVIPHFR